jgi:hypothetical protein
METTIAPPTFASFPESLVVAELRLILNIENEQRAREMASQMFAEVRKIFYASNSELALFYDMEFEIISARRDSWDFTGNVSLTLKQGWEDIKKNAPKAFIAVCGILAAYPQIREGAIQIAEDVKSAYEQVVDQKNVEKPELIKYFECRPPSPNVDSPQSSYRA